jgi:hypothetical protein
MMADQHGRTSKLWDIFNRYADRDRYPWPNKYKYNTEQGAIDYGGGVDGVIERGTAGDEHSGKGGTRNVLHYSEAAMYAHEGAAEDTKVISGSLASLAKTGNSLVILESTPYGAHGYFYRNWCKGISLERYLKSDIPDDWNGFITVFASWFEFTEQMLTGAKKTRTQQEIETIKNTITEREKRLIALYANEGPQGQRLGYENTIDTLWEQLAWRREELAGTCDGKESSFDENFPEDPESCFLSSGSMRFDLRGVTRLEVLAKIESSARHGILEVRNNYLLWLPVRDEAWLWVYEQPTEGREYIAFLDPATGEQASSSNDPDSHAFGVWRKGYMSHGQYIPTELACVIDVPTGCRWDDDLLVERISMVLKWYGDCMIIPEVNVKDGVANDLRNAGCLVYHRESFNAIQPGKQEKVIGWKTTPTGGGTRAIAVNAMAAAIRDETVNVRYKPFVDQLRTFVVNAKGKAEAAPGAHDDWVMGGAIGLACLDYATPYHKPASVEREKRSSGGLS